MIMRVLLPTPYFSRHFSFKGIRRGGRERGGERQAPVISKVILENQPPPHLSPSIGGARSRPPNRPNGVSRRRRPLKVISTRRALSATCGEPRPRPHRRPSSVVRSGAQVLRHGALGATTTEGGSSSSLSQSRSCRACVSTASVAVSPDLSRQT